MSLEGLTDEELRESVNRIQNRNDLDIKFVEKTDTFSFKCTRCGKCCMGYREDIILNPFDIYRMAKATNKTCKEIIDDYCVVYIGQYSGLPIVTLTYDKKNGWCKFLKFDLAAGGVFGCSINDDKPGACMNHPIGVARSISLEDGKKDLKYIKVEPCNNHAEEEVLVADWVRHYEETLDESDAGSDLQAFATSIMDLHRFVEDIEKIPTAPMRNAILNGYVAAFLSTAYDNYDLSRPFLEQVPAKKEIIKEHITKLYELSKKSGRDYTLPKREKGNENV